LEDIKTKLAGKGTIYNLMLNLFQGGLTPDISFLHLLNIYVYFQSANATSLVTFIGRISDSNLSFIMGCRSIDKKFSIDSFLDWKGHHWVFTCSLISHTQVSPDNSTTLANLSTLLVSLKPG